MVTAVEVVSTTRRAMADAGLNVNRRVMTAADVGGMTEMTYRMMKGRGGGVEYCTQGIHPGNNTQAILFIGVWRMCDCAGAELLPGTHFDRSIVPSSQWEQRGWRE